MIADIKKLQENRELSSMDIQALESGEAMKMFPVFMNIYNRKYINHFAKVVENIEKIIGKEVIIHEISGTDEYFAEHFACQMLHGDTDVLLGLSGSDESLLYLAGKFLKEPFDRIDEDSYDALCEVTNCINGNFAALLEQNEFELDIETPMCCDGCRISGNADFYVMKLSMDGHIMDIISVIDTIPYMS